MATSVACYLSDCSKVALSSYSPTPATTAIVGSRDQDGGRAVASRMPPQRESKPGTFTTDSLFLRGVGDGQRTVDALRPELDLVAWAQSIEDHPFHDITFYSKGINVVGCNQSQLRDRPVPDSDRAHWSIYPYNFAGGEGVTIGGGA